MITKKSHVYQMSGMVGGGEGCRDSTNVLLLT